MCIYLLVFCRIFFSRRDVGDHLIVFLMVVDLIRIRGNDWVGKIVIFPFDSHSLELISVT